MIKKISSLVNKKFTLKNFWDFYHFFILNNYWFQCESFVTSTSGGTYKFKDDLINAPPNLYFFYK